jgi:hypothetical protein
MAKVMRVLSRGANRKHIARHRSTEIATIVNRDTVTLTICK